MTKNYALSIAKSGGKSNVIATSSLVPELTETISRISRAFVQVEFRGNVQFFIMDGSTVIQASDVTYTDDVPTGIWQNTL